MLFELKEVLLKECVLELRMLEVPFVMRENSQGAAELVDMMELNSADRSALRMVSSVEKTLVGMKAGEMAVTVIDAQVVSKASK